MGCPAKAGPASEELGSIAPPRDKAAALMPQFVTPSTAPLQEHSPEVSLSWSSPPASPLAAGAGTSRVVVDDMGSKAQIWGSQVFGD
ncbi:hypothetical protein LA080_008147 [Diaporthe eres]|nr:hypothetical protein LA080_008147 [Diaporthe eres]